MTTQTPESRGFLIGDVLVTLRLPREPLTAEAIEVIRAFLDWVETFPAATSQRAAGKAALGVEG